MTQFSPRGAKVKQVGGQVGGQTATVQSKGGGFALDFTLDAITPDPQPCKPYEYFELAQPFNGYRLRVDITVMTRPTRDRAALSIASPEVGASPHRSPQR